MAFINKKIAFTIFSLLLLAVIYILSLQQDESDQVKKYLFLSTIHSTTIPSSNLNSSKYSSNSSIGFNKLSVAYNDLPSFKCKQNSEKNMAQEVDLQTNSYKSESLKSNYNVQNFTSNLKSNVDTSSFHFKNQIVTPIESSRFERNTDGQYATQNKSEKTNSVLEIAAVTFPVTQLFVGCVFVFFVRRRFHLRRS